MWSLRILNGPLAGKTFQLKEGENLIGRSPDCHIVIASTGISKRHAKIIISGQKFSVVDLQSSNGTFVNGIRVQSRILNIPQDKVSFYDVLVALEPYQQNAQPSSPNATNSVPFPGQQQIPAPHVAWPQQGNLAIQQQAVMQGPEPSKDPIKAAQAYLDEVAMPGVYRLLELFELKQVLGGFILGFVLLVTLLSVIPLMRITKASIERESRRRAMTIARTLATVNLPALQQGLDSALTTKAADYEDGVEVALIVSEKDGHILAPASKAGSYANEPFIHSARRQNREVVEQISDSMIGASVPIKSFNSDSGGYSTTAYAMVLYNMGTLAVDDSRTISLFVQTLLIALILGAALFFFLYKLIEHPIATLNTQLDLALRDERKNVQSSFQIPSLQKLIPNLNTALSRMSFGQREAPKNSPENRKQELANLALLTQNPAMILDKDQLICHVNQAFEDLSGMRLATVQDQSLEVLSDQALKLSIMDLTNRAQQQPGLIASNQLEIAGQDYDIDVQAIMGSAQVEFFFVAIKRKSEDPL